MTYREDHDAAIARADALENELDEQREKAELAQVQLEAERAERKRLQALVDKHQVDASIARLSTRPKRAEEWHPGPKHDQPNDLVGVGIAVLVVVAFLLFLLAVAMYS